ncbi:HAE1 family hydrophobic/amphiphilic exporter-1 [Salsuginibacillus halophilus]|uniref:HAE1 family hydrophobic/amphiphilic exporter-1 n=1 Tax=Salsuginibacillus halophilus TaxID=517424 RepID=A0A2P8H869_9BACI|nr:efflux RND transporter permease subunit [Salsuginibacillus halophilus]PSL42408.1 HAE1 family hydrophobic/amphiphilic exporter-1 [Salsuginibacillus halophilus]
MKLSNFSIRRPTFTIVIMVLFIVLGAVSLTRLPMQLFPDIEAPAAAVVTNYQGAGPEEVVEEVTEPLESELATVSGLNNITSQSSEGTSLILLEFSWDTDIGDVENDIISDINAVQLPDQADDPSFLRFDPTMMGSIQMAVTAGGDDIVDFQDDVSDLQRELSRVDGVADVTEEGGLSEQVDVALDQAELDDAGVDQETVIGAIQGHNITAPGGIIEDEEEELNISTRVLSELDSVEALEDVVVTVNPEDGEELTVADLADVELGPEDQNIITRANQEPAMELSVMEESEANTTQVSQDVQEEMDELLNEDRYDHLSSITLYDEGEFIEEAIDSVMLALISGGILAMVVLFSFLRNLKTPLIIGVAIPFSIIVTFTLLFFADISLNIMTLGGLALGIGMLVDNSIVVIENIYRHLSMKKAPKEAAAEGAKEVGGAITASTLTTISVFLPILFITGLVGDLFMPFALAVSFSLAASLLVALTVVPMLASRMLKAPAENLEAERQESRFVRTMESGVRFALRKRIGVLLVTLLLFIGGAAGMTTVGVDFIPDSDEGMFMVDVELEQGTILDRTAETVEQLEEELDTHDEIEDYMSITGSGSEGQALGGGGDSHQAEIIVSMVPGPDRDETTFEFAERIEDDLADVDEDADIEVSDPAQAGLGGEANTLQFTISDPDRDRLEETTDEITEDLEDESDLRDIRPSIEETTRELQVQVDEEEARDAGLAPGQIAEAVTAATLGETATTLQPNSTDVYQVIVSYDGVTDSIEAFENLSIQGEDGFVTLEDIAEIEEGEGPASRDRRDMEDAVDFDVVYSSDMNLGEASTLVEDVLDDVDIDDEATVTFGGDQELLEEAMENLVFAFALGLLLIYLVMSAQFDSLKYPFVIMFTVPLVFIGVMIALSVTQTPFDVMAFIGLIVLAGIVVNNSIVLVDYTNQRKAAGQNTVEAIVTAVKDRTRPILITALTTILGVTPLAIGIGEGTELQEPLGIVVIGGLISSTLLTLFVIPVVYSFFDPTTRRMNKKYVTPDGQLISAWELEQAKAESIDEEEIVEQEASEEMPSEEEIEGPMEEKTEEQSKENSDSKESELVDLLEEVVRRYKQNGNERDDDSSK